MSWFNFGNNWGEFVHRRIFMKAINKLKHLIDVNTENITNNHRQIMKNLQDISKNKADIQANSENIDLNKEHILLEQSELDNHSQSLESLSQSVSANSENIASNSTSLASQSQSLSSLSQSVSVNSENIASNSTSLASHSQSLESLSQSVSVNSENIASNSTSLSATSESVENISQSLSATSEVTSNNFTSIGSLTQELGKVAGQSTFTYNILNSASGPHIPQLYNTRFKLVGADFDNDGKLKEVIFTLQGTNSSGEEETVVIPLHGNNAGEFTISQNTNASDDITTTLNGVTSATLQCLFNPGTDTSDFSNVDTYIFKVTGKDPVTHETKDANIIMRGFKGLNDDIEFARSFQFTENGVTSQERYHIEHITAVHANHIGYTITLATESDTPTATKTINIPE